MPGHARKDVFRPDEVGVYHCWSRCVQQALLCGTDPNTGECFEYRRQWIEEREKKLAALFAVEVCFHTEMSNHIHVVLRNRPDIVDTWDDETAVRRWCTITKLTAHHGDGMVEPDEKTIQKKLANPEKVLEIRKRLSHISWFMKELTQYVARRANMERGKSGHFWEGRFGCKALPDEGAVLVCGMYVDLNQVRAGEATCPEESIHSSACDRIRSRQTRLAAESSAGKEPGPLPDDWLCALTLREDIDVSDKRNTRSATGRRASDKGLLPIELDDYLELLDWTGRQVRADKPGAIPSNLAPILDRLSINASSFLDTVNHFRDRFYLVAGTVKSLRARAAAMGRHYFQGISRCAQAFA